jgi:hypothetical protein
MMTAAAQSQRRSIDEIFAIYKIQKPKLDAGGSGYTMCPHCSTRRKPANRSKAVLHITANRDSVLGFCNHCSWSFGEFFEHREGRAVFLARYDYRDELGTVLFETVRLHPKDFRQRHPDGHGGWIWNLKDVRRVLYRLPELIAALKSGRKVVFIVEGEKDVERLRALNEVATCNPMGAGKWRDEFAEFLRGFDWAIVIADKDDAGRTHVQQVAALVSQVVPHVRVIEMPGDGIKDVSDFLAADGTVDEIVAIAKAAPDWGPGPAKTETWPEPDLGVLRLHRRPAVPLPIEVFGDRWARWIEDAAHAAACPVDYVVAPLLGASSALIGHARWARAWEGWVEPPHLWNGVVGDSGDGKSPGADTVIKHVVPEIEHRMAIDFPDRLREAQAAIEVAKAREEKWKAEVREAIKAGKTPPPRPSLGPMPEEPVAPRLMLLKRLVGWSAICSACTIRPSNQIRATAG